ncbi:hypothetical protein QBC47DRAFT_124278 [Echria macrotheca]|uniref:Uncharacterized protein n=1 Tax=Echria macrotheca TaxID=438768 RepID=A0AAJ0B275_9PEZI|nr:hypothetical protein QBC47DRAFT_124278 [Echria macrotheca]
MQFLSSLLLFSAFSSPVLAAVAGTTVKAAQAGELLFEHGPLTCRATYRYNRTVVDANVITRSGLPYLDARHRDCTIRKGQNGCNRVSCSHNAGIFVCANNIKSDVPLRCRDVASLARRIVESCESNDRVQGSVWDKTETFRVEIFHNWC